MKAFRVLAYAGLVFGTVSILSLACSFGSGHGGLFQAFEIAFNLAMILAALWILNQPEGTFTPRS